MIDKKIAIKTIHDVNPSHSEKILQTLDELNNLKIKVQSKHSATLQ